MPFWGTGLSREGRQTRDSGACDAPRGRPLTLRRFLILPLVVLAGTSPLSADGEVPAPSNKGTDFFVAFPRNVSTTPESSLHRPTLLLSAEVATKVEISGPEVATQICSLAASFVLEFVYTSVTPQVSLVNQVGSEGIRVRSIDPSEGAAIPANTCVTSAPSSPGAAGAPIAVYAVNRRPPGSGAGASTAAYMALPVEALGLEYRALSRPITSQVTVVGTQDNTTVQITTPVNVPGVTTAGVPTTIVLNPLQTLLLQSAVDDLTGTLLTADKPFAVLAGNQVGTVVSSATDHMVEQMIPASAWGDTFAIAPIGPATIGNSVIRVLAHESNTDVSVDGATPISLNGGAFHEFTLTASTGAWVKTSKPALVAQYKQGDAPSTDPLLMLVPPVTQFSRQYRFKTLSAPLVNSLNIVVRDGDEAGLRLNGATITATWIPIPTSNPPQKYARVPLPAGAVRLLEHTEPTVHFGAWVYGQATGEAYGYAAGQLVTDITPPTIAAGSVPQDIVKEATGPNGAIVTWETPTATDFGRGELPVLCNPESGSEIGLGIQIVTCSATDPGGNTAAASFNVTVRDTTPPVLQLPADITVRAAGPNGTVVFYTVTATDLVDLDVTVTCAPASGSVFPLTPERLTRQTIVTCTAADDSPDSPDAVGEFAVTVVNQAPVCTTGVPSISTIWPPNHQMVPISINGVVDPDDGDSVSIVISRIFQDEPTNGAGDGNTPVDGFGVGTGIALVRAERSGRGNGRVYHIGFTAIDSIGASCTGDVTVGVPHNRRRPAIDGGPLYDSTVPSVIARPSDDDDDDDRD